MKRVSPLAITLLCLVAAGSAFAQTAKSMSGKDLSALLENGVTLQLGGPGMGYQGTLMLDKTGVGTGSATTDAGQKISISGTWAVKGNKFCRTWADLDGGNEVCETWRLTSARTADVFNGNDKIGVNAW